MGRLGVRVWGSVYVVAVSVLVWQTRANAISLDKDGDIKFGARTYVNARVGTESTHDGLISAAGTPSQVSTSATFPHSNAGHLRQNRFYLEAELSHDLSRLLKEGVGPLSLLHDLPFTVKSLGYHFTFRGEGDGLYDWGPNEYSTAVEFNKARVAGSPIVRNQAEVDVFGNRHRLRKIASDRERLFQAYVEANFGDLFVRVGRQILSWGETDGFQLLDHINPIDSSFGGFLVSLDERRVPLDMLLTNYNLGDFGPITDAYLEGYAAIDNKVGYFPGTPAGSPWSLPSLGAPSNNTKSIQVAPARTVNNARGGVLLKFNALDATFSLAHYYTYFDTPALLISTPRGGIGRDSFEDDGLRCPGGSGLSNCGFPTHALQSAPKVQVSGATTTFALPQFYSVVRSEVAYFKDEPAFTQGQLDPFLFFFRDGKRGGTNGDRRLRDSINAVVGLDKNQWIRALNPNQTFFISTQFFYKHIKNGAGNAVFVRGNGTGGCANGALCVNPDREVLPITRSLYTNHQAFAQGSAVEPIFIRQPINTYLQTLFIGTSYHSGQVNPGLTIFYDWGGAFLYQPTVTFSHDPFRFAIDYSIIDAHSYKGGSGVSLLKDRDNIQFRFEYVI